MGRIISLDQARRRRSHRRRRAAGIALPPVQQGALVLAFDPALGRIGDTHRSLIGPAGIIGSTTGADTNDPTFVPGTSAIPPHYAFGVDDYINFGDALDAVWANNFGWTFLQAADITAVDLGTGTHWLFSKENTVQKSFSLRTATVGVLFFDAYYGGGSTNREVYQSSTPLTAGKHTVALRWNPTLARASRIKAYYDGANFAGTLSSVGADGTIADTTAELRLGLSHNAIGQGFEKKGPVYAWNIPLTDAEILAASAWLRGRGWQ